MDNNEAHEHTINLQTKLTEAQGDIDRLTKENKILTLKCASSLANNLCPDHRDKQAGKPCLACEIDRLKAENKRLRELVDGAREIVEIANCTSPAQCKWKVEWMQKASKTWRRQAMKDDAEIDSC